MPRMETERVESCTVTVRVPEPLKEDYDESLGDNHMSEDLRDHMRDVADVSDAADEGLPADEDHRKAFLALERIADTRDKVETDMAETTVANTLNLPKQAVKGAIFEPLEETGHLKPCWGKIRIQRVTPPEGYDDE